MSISVEHTLSLLRQQGPCTAKDAMCGPFPRSNWVLPGIVCIGPAPANPAQDGHHPSRATTEDLQTLIDCGIKKFVDLRGRIGPTYHGVTYLQNPDLMDVTDDLDYTLFEATYINSGVGGAAAETGVDRVNALGNFLRAVVAEALATERPVYIHGENGLSSEIVAACGILAVAYGISGLRACSVAAAQQACRDDDEAVVTLIPQSLKPFIKEVCLVCASTSPLMYVPNGGYGGMSAPSPMNNHHSNSRSNRSDSMPGSATSNSNNFQQQQQQQQPIQNYDPYQSQQNAAMQPMTAQNTMNALQNMMNMNNNNNGAPQQNNNYNNNNNNFNQRPQQQQQQQQTPQQSPYASLDPESFQNPFQQYLQQQQQNPNTNNINNSNPNGTLNSNTNNKFNDIRINSRANGKSSGGGLSSISFGDGGHSSVPPSQQQRSNSITNMNPYQQQQQQQQQSQQRGLYGAGGQQQQQQQPLQQDGSGSNFQQQGMSNTFSSSSQLQSQQQQQQQPPHHDAAAPSVTGHSRARCNASLSATTSSISWAEYGNANDDNDKMSQSTRLRSHQQMKNQNDAGSPTPIKAPFNNAANNVNTNMNMNMQQQPSTPLQFMNHQELFQQQQGNNNNSNNFGNGFNNMNNRLNNNNNNSYGGFSAPPPLHGQLLQQQQEYGGGNMMNNTFNNNNSMNQSGSIPIFGNGNTGFGNTMNNNNNNNNNNNSAPLSPTVYNNSNNNMNSNMNNNINGRSGSITALQNQNQQQQQQIAGGGGGGFNAPGIAPGIAPGAFPPAFDPNSGNNDAAAIRGPTPTSNWVIRGRLCCGAMPNVAQGRYIEALGRERFAFLVSLREKEPDADTIDSIAAAAGGLRPQVFHFPLNDGMAFANAQQASEFLSFTRRVVMTLEREPLARAYVFCQNGHGRTGMFVSMALSIAYGLSGMRAVNLCDRLHEQRANTEGQSSPQTHEQRTAVISLLKG